MVSVSPVGDAVRQPDIGSRKVGMHAIAPSQAKPLRASLFALVRCGLLLALTLLSACAGKSSGRQGGGPALAAPRAPAVTAEAPQEFVRWLDPRNQDLTSWREMGPTVRKSLRYVKSKPQDALAVNRPGLKLTWGEMRAHAGTSGGPAAASGCRAGGFSWPNFTWKAVPQRHRLFRLIMSRMCGPAARPSPGIRRPSTSCRRIWPP